MEHDMMDPQNVDSWFMEMLALQSNGIRMIFWINILSSQENINQNNKKGVI